MGFAPLVGEGGAPMRVTDVAGNMEFEVGTGHEVALR